jgi:farnesyl-diphosphate farnesyltransferase
MSDAEHRRVPSLKTGFSIRRLRGSILRSVSRSFYVSVRLLPRRLREPVALGYLLARSTDTVADTTEVSPAVRAEQLAILARAIQGKAPPNAVVDLARSFAPRQKNPDERALIESLPRCLEWLENIDPTDRNEIRAVLEKITSGQTLDLQRFPDATGVRPLPTTNDLDEYSSASENFGHVSAFAMFDDSQRLVRSRCRSWESVTGWDCS